MKTTLRVLGLLCLTWLIALPLYAQEGVRPQDVNVRITDMKIDTAKYKDIYPDVAGTAQGGREDWVRITISYDIEINKEDAQKKNAGGLFVNDLDFDWNVILSDETRAGKIDAKDVVRLTKSVRYIDLDVSDKRTRSKIAEIYIHPHVIKRFTKRYRDDNVFCELRVKSGGKTIETAWAEGKKWTRKDSEKGNFTPRDKDGKNLYSSEDVAERKDGLLNRHETPWLYFSEDNVYETIGTDNSTQR